MNTKEKQQESKKAGNMEDISDMGAVIQSLKSELDQSEKRYLSAVKGRKEFRQLYCKSRDAQNESRNKIAQLEKEKEELWKNHLIDEIHPDADTAESKQYDKDGEIVAHTSSTNLNLKDAEA